MGKHYKHLTWRERLRIETRLKDGWTPQKIADEIGRHVSTIYREIKRGLGVQRTTDLIDYECYIPEIARENLILKYRPGPFTAISKWGLYRAFQAQTSPLNGTRAKRKKSKSQGPPGIAGVRA